jgi:hypothetical protein
MLEYLSPASPPALCELYTTELQQYYGTDHLILYRAALPHRYLAAANQGVFVVSQGRLLHYITQQGPVTHELPFTPVSIGLREDYLAWLLDENGQLWYYEPASHKCRMLLRNVLAIAPDAMAFVLQDGQACITKDIRYIPCEAGTFVGTRNWGTIPTFCDIEGQWYLGQSLIPFARAECQQPHPDNSMHYLTANGTLCWMQLGPTPVPHTLLKDVCKITGSHGSIVAETHTGNRYFFMVTAQVPYYCTARGEVVPV